MHCAKVRQVSKGKIIPTATEAPSLVQRTSNRPMITLPMELIRDT